ncbi:MAG TPA: DNA methyltransferase, partial [Anaerolineae bacterium]|nr:DNA methyltransferase [Anaerolineae bacterium]
NELKPKVRAVTNLRNQGAGMPDGGLFTASQFRRGADLEALSGQIPERGAIEVKSPREDAESTANGEQVTGYLDRYGLVLVSNLRDFILVQKTSGGASQIVERYTLAGDESAFWQMTRSPRQSADLHNERLVEFLKRAMLYRAELSEPKDLAWFLASYARDAHAKVDAAGDLPALATLRQAMQQALNMEFASEKGEHFFRSTLVQTLFYGVFSAWVLWHHENPAPGARFDWHTATYLLKVPVIQSLFHQLSDPSKLKALGITDYLDLTGETLNRVNRAAFFTRFERGQAVQYFYEPFLEAYDPELRKEMGVWYTPREIVDYMVARVDTVLRQELGLPDGLADPNVYILDPCCGTGAYPLAVLERIAQTLREKGEDALLGYELKRAATERVFGFELLPAPFVIAHLQAGLFLQQYGAPLGEGERASVYLTNALTGWEPPKGPKQRFLMSELEQERDAAERVKRETPILVILGNPPYNAFAGVAESDEEKDLIKPYKEGLIEKWGIKKFNLDDLYVRFFRLAERRIAEKTGRGVVCFISNHSWTKEPSFVVLRENLLRSFDKFWIENMHGDRKISEYAPDGRTSETIFAMQGFSPGIQQGTAISLWVKSGKNTGPRVVFRDDLTEAKAQERREHLLATLQEADFEAAYQPADPGEQNRYSFRPLNISAHYLEWPKVVDLCLENSNGLMEKRGGALMDTQKDALEKRMKAYFDPQLAWDDYKTLGYGLTDEQSGFEPKSARMKAIKAEKFSPERIVRYALRPFDNRWCYYTAVSPIWNRSRPTLWAQHWQGNQFFMTRPSASTEDEGVPFFFTSLLGDNDFQRGHAYYFPLRLKKEETQIDMFSTGQVVRANLSDAARAYLASLSITDPDNGQLENGLHAYEIIWLHALAIGYAPAYLNENKDGIQNDWPRIPLPASRAALVESAVLGKIISGLLDTENQLDMSLRAVNALLTAKQSAEGQGSPSNGSPPGDGRLLRANALAHRPDVLTGMTLPSIAVLRRSDNAQINPQAGDLAVEAGWGSFGKENVVMPGKGTIVTRGESLDVYLNENVYWENIPVQVWEYTIGGYQVIKKWLSYREKKILGRDISVEEAREVTGMARRIAALLALEAQLDENYRRVKGETVGL